MKPRELSESDPGDFDPLDKGILQALKEEGVIIPETVEDVRRAKARLKERPITVPPFLRDSAAVFEKSRAESLAQVSDGHSCQTQIQPRKALRPRGPNATTDEFVEAIVIAQLVREMSSPNHPLGRKRYNKLAYLSHRKSEDDVFEHYLKKAAGPYSPWAKYGGPEKIALKNGYVQTAKVGVFEGLVSGKNIDKIDQYRSHYPVCTAVTWIVDQLRYKKNDELELLATVDFAALDLSGKTSVTVFAIKHVLGTNQEWAPKLKRDIFSDDNIARALKELRGLFPAMYSSCSNR